MPGWQAVVAPISTYQLSLLSSEQRQHFLFGDGYTMNVEISSLRRPQGLFLAAAILRLVFFYASPGLPELVAGRVEVSTPVNSFKRCACPGDDDDGDGEDY